MKYISLHTGEEWLAVIFKTDHRHRKIWELLNRLWGLHPLRPGEDEKFLAPINAGFVHFPGSHYDTFDRSTTLNLSSSPACGPEMYKGFTSSEGGQFLMLPGDSFIALSKPIFDPIVMQVSQERALLGEMKCHPQQGSKRLDVTNWVLYPGSVPMRFQREQEIELARTVNCYSPFALMAGL